ncbi:F-box/LRR-repeat protein 4 isoform X2 [Aplysia californica]|nr:F-box/LRR-repeat protein 4 isoform X2 [Aplysia californica]
MYNQRYQAEGPPPYHPSAVKQWVKKVGKYSSQYNDSTWSANQVIGPPKVYPRHGDIHGSWASGTVDSNQFIEVEFDVLVRPTAVNIYETFNPGAVVAVKAQDPMGKWVPLWTASRPQTFTASRIFSPSLKDVVVKTNVLRIEIDCSAAATWCEIDAVELVGIRDGAVMPADDGSYFVEIGSLVNNKLHSDMKFEIDGKSVYAHKAILAARSKYFANMFKREKEKKCDLKLPDVSYKDILAVLQFIYTNRLPLDCSTETLVSICNAATTFELPDMKKAATYKVLESLCCSNVVHIYMGISKDRSLAELEAMCKKFMADNLKDMSKERSFESLPQSVIVEIVQIATAKMCINN